MFWRINGSRLNVEISPLGINARNDPLPGGGRVSILEIGGLAEHNGTTIECSSDLDGSVMTTSPVTFFMQGQLQFSI